MTNRHRLDGYKKPQAEPRLPRPLSKRASTQMGVALQLADFFDVELKSIALAAASVDLHNDIKSAARDHGIYLRRGEIRQLRHSIQASIAKIFAIKVPIVAAAAAPDEQPTEREPVRARAEKTVVGRTYELLCETTGMDDRGRTVGLSYLEIQRRLRADFGPGKKLSLNAIRWNSVRFHAPDSTVDRSRLAQVRPRNVPNPRGSGRAR